MGRVGPQSLLREEPKRRRQRTRTISRIPRAGSVATSILTSIPGKPQCEILWTCPHLVQSPTAGLLTEIALINSTCIANHLAVEIEYNRSFSNTAGLTQDCHFVNWLDACDSVWLNKTHYKDEKRGRLVSAIMFNTGWTLDDPKPGMLVSAEIAESEVFSQDSESQGRRRVYFIFQHHHFFSWRYTFSRCPFKSCFGSFLLKKWAHAGPADLDFCGKCLVV